MDDSERGKPGLTETQDYLTNPGISPLAKYRRLAVGEDRGWGALAVYETLTGLLGPLPGAAGFFLRRACYPAIFKSIGRGTVIGRNVTVRHPGRISLGADVFIDENVLLDAREGEIVIGDKTVVSRDVIISTRGGSIRIGANCSLGSGSRVATLSSLAIDDYVLIAANCYLGGGNHRHDRIDVPVISQGMEEQKGVIVGRGAWLGTGSIVLDGVTVGADAIIGAMTLVNQNIPSLAVAVGQPAKVMRYRDGR